MSLFLKLDLFKHPLFLLFNSQSKLSSYPGLLLSSLIYVLFLFFLINSNMYSKSNPYVISEILTGITTNKIQFNENTHMTFQVADPAGKFYLDPSIFTINVRKYHFQIINGTQKMLFYQTEILQPCISTTFNTLTSFCLKNKSLTLNGYINELETEYMNVQLLVCNNITSNNSCKSKEEISKFFGERKLFSTNIHSAEIDVNNFDNPIAMRNNVNFFIIDPNLLKKTHFYFKKIEISSDEGWLLEDKKYHSDFKVDYLFSDFVIRDKNENPLIEFNFFASYNYDTVFRRYQKLPEVLGSFAETNLYINVLKKILNALYVFPEIKKKKKNSKKLFKFNLKKKKKNNNINNDIDKKNNLKFKTKSFDFLSFKENNNKSENLKKNNEENLNKSQDSISKEKDKESSNLKLEIEYISKPQKKTLDNDSFILENYSKNVIEINEIKNDENNLKQHSPKSLRRGTNIKNDIIETINKKKNSETFKLSIIEYFKFKFYDLFNFPKDEKQEIIKKAELLYVDQLDIVKILSKIQEIEKIKLILLDDNQLKLFDLLAKPMCCNNNYKLMQSSSMILSQRMSNYKNENNKEFLKICYEKVFENSKNNQISKRLISLVDKNVIEMKEN